MNYEALFVNPNGRTSRAEYVPALITVLAVLAFFALMVTGRTAQFCMLVLMYPAFVLLTRRMHDMGKPGWLLLLPLTLTMIVFAIWLGYASLGPTVDAALIWIAVAVSAGFGLAGCLKK